MTKSSASTTLTLGAIAPGLFVILWSTGFIGAKYGLPYAEPFTFLFVRMVLACALLLAISRATRARFPRPLSDWGHISVSGLLLHAGYLGGVFFAIDRGLPAGLASLIVGLQPILTAVLAQRLLREHVSPRQWLGLLLGFAGVGLVVEEKATASLDESIRIGAYVAISVALLATTFGTLYQKRFVRTVDLAAGGTIQYLAAGIVFGLLSVAFEERTIEWNPRFLFALGWLVLVLSVGAILLLLRLIREHSVSRISSLLYLVPPMTAIQAYLFFDERLGFIALIGIAAVAIGVVLVVRQPRDAAAG